MKETSEYSKRITHKCEAQTKTTLKLTCTNMVLLDGSTCITSLLINQLRYTFTIFGKVEHCLPVFYPFTF